MKGRILVVAGSDSGGGAGLQADLKTITVLGGYAMTAVTALTAQDTRGVSRIVGVDADFVAEQMRLGLDDIGADAVKTGMLHGAETVRVVAKVLRDRARDAALVVDPVMIAKGGASLLRDDATESLVRDLFPLATLLTPNAPEAEALTGEPVRRAADLEAAADRLLATGPRAVLVKGGHLEGDDLVDLLKTREGEVLRLTSKRVATRSTHGTGCTYASAIATFLAQGAALAEAVGAAHAFVAAAIAAAPGLGHGHGPLDHAAAASSAGTRPAARAAQQATSHR